MPEFMLEAFYIPSPVLAAMAAGSALPLIVLVFSHPPLLIRRYSHRYWTAVWVAAALWVGYVCITTRISPVPWQQAGDILAGALVFVTACWVGFSVWCLLVWGFTISMLLRIADAPAGMNLGQWIQAYAGAQDIGRLAEDRLALVLNHGFARTEDRVVALTGRGRTLAALLRMGSWFFGLTRK